jgi:hypothetical protein
LKSAHFFLHAKKLELQIADTEIPIPLVHLLEMQTRGILLSVRGTSFTLIRVEHHNQLVEDVALLELQLALRQRRIVATRRPICGCLSRMRQATTYWRTGWHTALLPRFVGAPALKWSMDIEVRHHPPTQSIGFTYNFKISRLVELMRPAPLQVPEMAIFIARVLGRFVEFLYAKERTPTR